MFIYNELLIFSALVGIYIYVLLYAVYGQSPSIQVVVGVFSIMAAHFIQSAIKGPVLKYMQP